MDKYFDGIGIQPRAILDRLRLQNCREGLRQAASVLITPQVVFLYTEGLEEEHFDQWVELRATAKLSQNKERLLEDVDLCQVLLGVLNHHRIHDI